MQDHRNTNANINNNGLHPFVECARGIGIPTPFHIERTDDGKFKKRPLFPVGMIDRIRAGDVDWGALNDAFNQPDVNAGGFDLASSDGPQLVVIDLDDKSGTHGKLIGQLLQMIRGVCELYEYRPPIARTPSGAFHVYIRSPLPEQRRTVARYADGSDMVDWRAGNLLVAAPLDDDDTFYKWIDEPEIDMDGRWMLDTAPETLVVDLELSLAAFNKFDDATSNDPKIRPYRPTSTDKYDTTPWDAYNNDPDEPWSTVLNGAGWTCRTYPDKRNYETWTRPGKRGVCAAWYYDNRRLYMHTSNPATGFPAGGRFYTPVDILKYVVFDGDWNATLEHLVGVGYGDERPKQERTTGPTFTIPEFPLHVFPPRIREAMRTYADMADYPVAALATAALFDAMTNAGVSTHAIRPPTIAGGALNYGTTFVSIIGHSSDGKSQAAKLVWKTAENADAAREQHDRNAQREYERKRESGDDDIGTLPVPTTQIPTGEITRARLIRVMANQHIGIVAHFDEMSTLWSQMNSGHMVTDAVLMSAHQIGRPQGKWTNQTGNETPPQYHMGIVGNDTFTNVARYFERGRHDNGFAARWLFAITADAFDRPTVPKFTTHGATHAEQRIAEHAGATIHKSMSRLAGLQFGHVPDAETQKTYVLHVHPDDLGLIHQFYDVEFRSYYEYIPFPPGKYRDVVYNWLGKFKWVVNMCILNIAMLRWAESDRPFVTHARTEARHAVFERFDEYDNPCVDTSDVVAGIVLGRYFFHAFIIAVYQWQRVNGETRSTHPGGDASSESELFRIVREILSGDEPVKKTDLASNPRIREITRSTPAALDSLLQRLIQSGHVDRPKRGVYIWAEDA